MRVWVQNAFQFLKNFSPIFMSEGKHLPSAIEEYRKLYGDSNLTFTDHSDGFTRDCILNPMEGWVIKIDRRRRTIFGNCKSEWNHYLKAVRDGYDYLLAPMERIKMNGYTWYIYEYIDDVGVDEFDNLNSYFSDEEIDYLNELTIDLHSGNYGFRDNREAVIIDYAGLTRKEERDGRKLSRQM